MHCVGVIAKPRAEWKPTVSQMMRIVSAIAGAAAVLCSAIPSSQAGTYGNAPWCAVVEIGRGEVEWDCQYMTVAQCQPNVIAGNRGFCGLNPYYVAAHPPMTHRPRRPVHKHPQPQ